MRDHNSKSKNGGGAIVAREEPSEERHHLHVNFSSNSTLIIYDDDAAPSSWYTCEEEGHFKQLARQEIMRINRITNHASISSSSYAASLGGRSRASDDDGSRRSIYGDDESVAPCPVGLENSLISYEHTCRRAESKRLVIFAVLREQARPRGQHAHMECIAKASRQASEWSRAQAQAIGYFQALVANDQQVRSYRQDLATTAVGLATSAPIIDNTRVVEQQESTQRRSTSRHISRC